MREGPTQNPYNSCLFSEYSDFELILLYDNGQFVTSVTSYEYLTSRVSREIYDYN